MKNVPNLANGQNQGKGLQLEYTLVNLAAIETVVLEEENPVERILQSLDDKIVCDCEHKMEELRLAKQKFNDLYEQVKENEQVLNGQVLVDFNAFNNKTTDENTFWKNFGQVLVQVRFLHFYF